MSNFKLIEQLSTATQKEITRILALSAASRTASEQAFLDARIPYQYNRVIRYDRGVSTPQNPLPDSTSALIKS
jgi:uncharacterized iron-regulated protein